MDSLLNGRVESLLAYADAVNTDGQIRNEIPPGVIGFRFRLLVGIYFYDMDCCIKNGSSAWVRDQPLNGRAIRLTQQ